MNTFDIIRAISSDNPLAYATIRGTTVAGSLVAYGCNSGTIIVIEAEGLPTTGCNQGIHAVAIHAGSSCQNTDDAAFGNSGDVLNLSSCPRPYRTGDLPPLLSSEKGIAWYAFYTEKFTPQQIIGRTVIVNQGPNSFLGDVPEEIGPRIACGEIIELQHNYPATQR